MKRILILLMLATALILPACSADSAGYQTIRAEKAHRMMQEMSSYILLDVRTDEEFTESHISGAILIPHDEIEGRAEQELPDKDAAILIYCRSGRRSAIAAETLTALGYANVYDFGGINDWPYDTVTETEVVGG